MKDKKYPKDMLASKCAMYCFKHPKAPVINDGLKIHCSICSTLIAMYNQATKTDKR